MTPPKTWDEVLPAAVVGWAWKRLHAECRGEPCVDNFRVALKRNSSQRRRYRNVQKRGCCGSHDFEAVGPDGETYLLGYNYGH